MFLSVAKSLKFNSLQAVPAHGTACCASSYQLVGTPKLSQVLDIMFDAVIDCVQVRAANLEAQVAAATSQLEELRASQMQLEERNALLEAVARTNFSSDASEAPVVRGQNVSSCCCRILSF